MKNEKPLVTFALFAYNQEEYIIEALEGAFNQTYEPLELIISDDCSTDRTFEIMQDMVANYKGPKVVRLNRNKENLGLIEHVNLITSISNGSIFLFAAGDDISLQNRTEKTVSLFLKKPNVVLVHSSVIEIDKNSNIIGKGLPPFGNPYQIENLIKSGGIYIGATGAIRKNVIDYYGPIKYKDTFEDLIYGTRAALLGEIGFSEEELIKYRINLGLSIKMRQISNRIERRKKSIIHRISTMKQRKADIIRSKHTSLYSLLIIANKEIIKAQARLDFYDRKILFIKGIISSKVFYYLHAFWTESRYLLRFIK